MGCFSRSILWLGAYPDEKPLETSKKHRRTKICWLGTWNATTWCFSSPEWGLTPSWTTGCTLSRNTASNELYLTRRSTARVEPHQPPTKDVCLAFIEIDRSIAHRSQHLHRSRHNTYTVRVTHMCESRWTKKKVGLCLCGHAMPWRKRHTHASRFFQKHFRLDVGLFDSMLDSLICAQPAMAESVTSATNCCCLPSRQLFGDRPVHVQHACVLPPLR